MRWWLAAVIPVWGACAAPDPLRIDGMLGAPMAASFAGGVPRLAGTVAEAPADFLLDTGAPVTLVDDALLPGEAGSARADLGLPGFTFRGVEVLRAPLGGGTGAGGALLGGDILSQLALALDYRAGEVTLGEPGSLLPAGDGATRSQDLQLAGGGTVWFGGAQRDAGPTRLLARVWLEDRVWPLWAVIDTGASSVVVSRELFDQLAAADARRPVLRGAHVLTPEGPVAVTATRVGSLAVGAVQADASEAGDLPTLVVEETTLFDDLSLEVGEPVELLLGGTWLRCFATVLDPMSGRALLSPYTTLPHVSSREFVGLALELVPPAAAAAADWTVGDVYAGRSADKEGILPGDLVLSLAGEPLKGQDAAFVAGLTASLDVGASVSVVLSRGGVSRAVTLPIEDLLPSYTAPPGGGS